MRAFLAISILLATTMFASSDDFSDSIKAFDRCYVQQLDMFRHLCDPADKVATNIVNGCPKEMRDFIDAASKTWGAPRAYELAAQLGKKRQDQAIAALMRERLQHPCPK
ncbi:hypothetical protein [Mesorhizobium loti]|uniref:hypothetical protein n=1 Tax=Rhizobium loti TaxID=381 RepID=UPI00047A17AE|nr:hypothetical protein [Mesorhizobium loti]